MRGNGSNVSADANISCLELRLVTNLSSCSQRLDLGHERSAALACIAHEVSDLSLLREIVEQEGHIRHILFNILVVNRDNTDDGLAWDEQKGCDADHNWLIIREFSCYLGLFKDILISANLHANH